MSFKSIVREVRDGIGSMSMRVGCSGGAAEDESPACPPPIQPRPQHYRRPEKQQQRCRWADLPPELLRDVVRRLEASEASWPGRRAVVACASVCRSWREVTREIVRTPEQCARITFPIALKQPGPRDTQIQCFIRRERSTGTFRLYLGLSPALEGDHGKFLLTARKFRRATSMDYLISLASDDFSKASGSYIGKLRSNFLGTKFNICDSQPPNGSTVASNSRSIRRIHSQKVSPRAPAGNYNIGTICYELNLLRTRGPRRMHCTMHSIPASSVQDGGAAPTPTSFFDSLEEHMSVLSAVNPKCPLVDFSSRSLTELPATGEPLVLKNKAPRWHEQLQCWCLNFRGRVTVASVKNFQLVAAIDPSNSVSLQEQDRVILQFGKIGKDIFTMDYRYPLSAFQAFAICLSSFDTKPGYE